LVYQLDNDPYTSLAAYSQDDGGTITPEDVAKAIADAAELDAPPLRVPVGDAASYVLNARKAAPEDVPFTLGA